MDKVQTLQEKQSMEEQLKQEQKREEEKKTEARKAEEKKTEAAPAEKPLEKPAEKKEEKKELKEEKKEKPSIERLANIPLSRAYAKPRSHRGRVAMSLVKQYAAKHLKASVAQVRVAQEINSLILARGSRHPPRMVRALLRKYADGTVKVETPEGKKPEAKKPAAKASTPKKAKPANARPQAPQPAAEKP